MVQSVYEETEDNPLQDTNVSFATLYNTKELLKGSGIQPMNFINYLQELGHIERLQGSTYKFKDESLDEDFLVRGEANGYPFCKWTEEGKDFVIKAIKIYKNKS